MYHRREPQTEREQYLEAELERMHGAEEHRYREEERRHNERIEELVHELGELVRQHKERQRTASDWPEALLKQIRLFRREADLYPESAAEDDFFGPGAEACGRALYLWIEEEQAREAAIAALQAQIADLREGIRRAVADRLAPGGSSSGWQEVVRALREESDPTDWLRW